MDILLRKHLDQSPGTRKSKRRPGTDPATDQARQQWAKPGCMRKRGLGTQARGPSVRPTGHNALHILHGPRTFSMHFAQCIVDPEHRWARACIWHVGTSWSMHWLTRERVSVVHNLWDCFLTWFRFSFRHNLNLWNLVEILFHSKSNAQSQGL